MKDIEDVVKGDTAICYCGENWTVVNTALNFADAQTKFSEYLSDFNDIIEDIDQSEPIILVNNSEYGTVAFMYDYDGAFVE